MFVWFSLCLFIWTNLHQTRCFNMSVVCSLYPDVCAAEVFSSALFRNIQTHFEFSRDLFRQKLLVDLKANNEVRFILWLVWNPSGNQWEQLLRWEQVETPPQVRRGPASDGLLDDLGDDRGDDGGRRRRAGGSKTPEQEKPVWVVRPERFSRLQQVQDVFILSFTNTVWSPGRRRGFVCVFVIIRCERFLRPEEEFWVWIKLNHGSVGLH